MEKDTVNNIEYVNFGANNYSCEMEAVVFNPKDITPEEVQKLHGFFLHPTQKPNQCEIFALKGRAVQFHVFMEEVRECYASKKAVTNLGGIPPNSDREAWNKLHELEEHYYMEFKPWYVQSALDADYETEDWEAYYSFD